MVEPTRFTIAFDILRSAQGLRVPTGTSAQAALDSLSLPPFGAIIVMHGGAGGMEPELTTAIQRFFTIGLAPFAQEHHVLVADGATRSGTIAAMGDARHESGGTYPLVGVVPSGVIAYPGGPDEDDSHYPLDPYHSHFLLVEGDEFGIETDVLVGLLQAAGVPGIALIVNGGQIVLDEARQHAALGNTLVVVRGSGRIADELADPNSEARASLGPTANVEIAHLSAPEMFSALLARLLL